MIGATLSGVVLSSSNESYVAVAMYAGSMMVGGAVILLFGEFERFVRTEPVAVANPQLRRSRSSVRQREAHLCAILESLEDTTHSISYRTLM